ncbi:MAG: Fe-S cluster assembly protein SufD [Phenylobacterium sp.]|uniref:Fe-S cluster assembly protein SufD n=1 Tax=Phenylobacterium sp. TaxID=1871053 RepID=UPI00391A640B
MSLAEAIRTRDLAQLPGKRDEDWRWTDLKGLLRALPPASEAVQVAEPGPFDALAQAVHVLANGGGTEIAVAAGAEQALALRFVARGEGSHAATARIAVGEGGRVTLFETYEGDEAAYVADAALAVSLAPGARLERIVLASDGAEGVRVTQAEVVLAPGASFAQTTLTSGARRQRLETRVRHPGGQAQVRLDGAYLLAGKRHADLTTEVAHEGVDGTTSQLAKGVVRDQARGVFQGRILVAQGADRTDARMGHHALILSDRAEVDAKPELLIFADDVQCAHGNTIGALDEDALFYAEQRGMPEEVARALLTEAFVGEVVDRIEHEAAREIVRAWAAERLGA